MSAGTTDLTIEAGATFSLALAYQNPDTTPVILTGWTAKWQARVSPSAAETVIDETPVIDGPTGTITLSLTAAQTALLEGPYEYAVELTGPGGTPVIRLVEGRVLVSPELVR